MFFFNSITYRRNLKVYPLFLGTTTKDYYLTVESVCVRVGEADKNWERRQRDIVLTSVF